MEDLKRPVHPADQRDFRSRDFAYYIPENESGILKAGISVSRLAYERKTEEENGRDNKTETKRATRER